MSATLISICIPTYNGEKYLEQCLDSAIAQTYKNIEIIIVDDHSKDETWNIVNQYRKKDERIRIYRNENNLGLVGNWNRCLELAKGEWIKFLFQDDYLSPECINIMVEAISIEDRIISSARRLVLDESLDEKTRSYSVNQTLTFERLGIVATSPVFISAKQIASFVAKNICINFIGEPTVIMFRKDVIKEFGLFNPDIVQICDLEYFLRVSSKYGLKYVPQPLTYFRVHKGSASSINTLDRYFFMRFSDQVIVTHELLYSDHFSELWKNLTMVQMLKVKLFFNIRMRETFLQIKNNTVNEKVKAKFNTLDSKYNFTYKYKRKKILVLLLLSFVKPTRRLKL